MKGDLPDAWLAALQAQADQPPAAFREPLWLATPGVEIGSIEPALAAAMVDADLPIHWAEPGWCITAAPDADAALARIAAWLNQNGHGSRWRGELLAVTETDGGVLARIERAVVRPLGIATHAVHLVGHAPDGGVWVQQRALDKATDPGLWDTLMGGLMAAGETVAQTLARETWEEAGLRLDAVHGLQPRGLLSVRRPVADGYMIEHIHVFGATVPAGLAPQNQDGEVAGFACLGRAALAQRLVQGAFTLEAALILADVLAADGKG